VRVKRSEEGGRRWWCVFNALVLVVDGKRQDEALPKDEAEAASASLLHGKEAGHGASAWRCRSNERQYRARKRGETMSVGLTRILLG
jgi:hypothetical protein